MRLNHAPEVTNIRQTETFELRPDLTLELQSLPPDYDDQVEAELPAPQPKRLGFEKDQRGRTLTDADGRPVARFDTDDPEYKKALAVNQKLQAIKMIVDGLAPDQITFESEGEGPAFYKGVLQELKAFGFGLGDILAIVKAIGRLSGISEEELKTAEMGFTETAN